MFRVGLLVLLGWGGLLILIRGQWRPSPKKRFMQYLELPVETVFSKPDEGLDVAWPQARRHLFFILVPKGCTLSCSTAGSAG